MTNFVSDAHNSFACKSFLTATKVGRVCTQVSVAVAAHAKAQLTPQSTPHPPQDGCQDCGDLNILQIGTCIVNSRRSYCA